MMLHDLYGHALWMSTKKIHPGRAVATRSHYLENMYNLDGIYCAPCPCRFAKTFPIRETEATPNRKRGNVMGWIGDLRRYLACYPLGQSTERACRRGIPFERAIRVGEADPA